MVLLGVNLDHFATIRNARFTHYPDIERAALYAIESGADFITIHLREDRRHIKDSDAYNLKKLLQEDQLNLEIAATEEMCHIVCDLKPHAVCIVPEKRAELTTEGGMNLQEEKDKIAAFISKIKHCVRHITIFVDPDIKQIEIARQIEATAVEIHTGSYANTKSESDFSTIKTAASYSESLGIMCHAGHGLTFETAHEITKIQNIKSLNIGHFLVAESLFVGLKECIQTMLKSMGRQD